jgi:hypothetical protein
MFPSQLDSSEYIHPSLSSFRPATIALINATDGGVVILAKVYCDCASLVDLTSVDRTEVVALFAELSKCLFALKIYSSPLTDSTFNDNMTINGSVLVSQDVRLIGALDSSHFSVISALGGDNHWQGNNVIDVCLQHVLQLCILAVSQPGIKGKGVYSSIPIQVQ